MNPETVSQKTYEQQLLITFQKYLQKSVSGVTNNDYIYISN